MSRNWWMKFIALVTFTGISLVYVAPTILGMDSEKSSFLVKKKVNLGLDLQGGLSMVYGVDFKKVYREILNRQMESLRQTVSKGGGAFTSNSEPEGDGMSESEPMADPHVQIHFSETSKDLIRKTVKDSQVLRIVSESSTDLGLGLSRTYRDEIRNNTLAQSIEVIRNRVDEFGVTEPAISSQGEDRVVVELPGVKDIDRAKQLVGRTAKLEFKIVNDKAMSPEQLAHLISDLETQGHIQYVEGQRFSEYVEKLNGFAKSKIPEGTEIAFERSEHGLNAGTSPEESQTRSRSPYLLFSKTDVTGKDLRDAQVNFDQENHSPIVNFELNASGTETFGKLTGDHRGERLAIVLDGVVHSAPVIQSQIAGGRGQITLGRGGGEARLREAKDLAIVLRAGALPAQLELLEQRAIGPTLGQDSIKQGLRAAVVGCTLVFIFMVFYYRMSGVVAVISLLLNGLFAFAILIGMDATLTLPGIAGLALVIGMAVDSNVIIFERIRDELEEGKNPGAAIESGFSKAFTSIFDANITHGIIGLILLNFGTGPIKGFAVMLLIGIVTTLFTAVTVCKLIFDGYVSWMHAKHRKIENLSI